MPNTPTESPMTDFLVRAKALAYDIDKLRTDMRIERNTLIEEAHHGADKDNTYRTRELFRSDFDLKDMLRLTELIISREAEAIELELPELPLTGGQG